MDKKKENKTKQNNRYLERYQKTHACINFHHMKMEEMTGCGKSDSCAVVMHYFVILKILKKNYASFMYLVKLHNTLTDNGPHVKILLYSYFSLLLFSCSYECSKGNS